MRVAAAMLVAMLCAGWRGARAQETQAEPSPAGPTPGDETPGTAAGCTTTQKAAPVERRASKPSAEREESRWRGR